MLTFYHILFWGTNETFITLLCTDINGLFQFLLIFNVIKPFVERSAIILKIVFVLQTPFYCFTKN